MKIHRLLLFSPLLVATFLFSAPLVDKAAMDAAVDEAAMVVGRVENGYVAADIDLDGYDGNFQEGGGGPFRTPPSLFPVSECSDADSDQQGKFGLRQTEPDRPRSGMAQSLRCGDLLTLLDK